MKKSTYDFTLTNGIAWSPDYTIMYVVDSAVKKIYSFDYDESTSTLTNQTLVIDYNIDQNLGMPDGLTVDIEGKLWVAGYYSGKVLRWDPKTGEKLAYVPIPAKCVTSCCFGGPNYDKLFVTSAKIDSYASDLGHYHRPGAVFVVQSLGVCGLPSHKCTVTK